MSAATPDVAEAFAANRAFLWSVCYRLTGTAADAEDVVQDTFVRALERPPTDTSAPWRPWLVRVAVNLARDLLRRRRRRAYDGVWLPGLVDTEALSLRDPALGPGARYDMMESASLAFLLALEALSVRQRAVLVLRDVFDFSVRETAAALDVSEDAVKTTHLRARRALGAYVPERRPPAARRDQARQALEAFLGAVAAGDLPRAQAALAPGVQALSDGGGVYHAARNPVRGPDRVTRLFAGLQQRAAPVAMAWRHVNGRPSLVLDFGHGHPAYAPRVVLQADVDATGHIVRLYTVLAPRKLPA